MDKKTDRCEELIARDRAVIAPCTHLSYFPLAVASADGAILTDEDGSEFIDFLSSASSLNVGSRSPEVMRAMREQMERVTQYAIAYTYGRPSIEYAERLTSSYPGGVRAKIAFGNCGSDANDAAIKFARAYTGRSDVILFTGSYHGSTYGSIGMSACAARLHSKIGPFMPGLHFFPFFGSDLPDDEVERDCLRMIETAFESYLAPEEVAACVIEPVQGDGGLLPAHPIFMRKLHEICAKHGILFISDEVQQGFWRTGKMFGIEHYGIVPDGIVMGKSIGAGATLGAFMARAEIMDSLPAPAHAFTLGGNALACAAGAAAFDLCKSDEFQRALASNIKLLTRLGDELKARHPRSASFTRQLGMSMGIGITKDGAPDHDGVFKIVFRSYERGLIVISLAGYVLRIQPPLTIEPELLERGFAILNEAIDDYENGRIPDDVLRYRAGW